MVKSIIIRINFNTLLRLKAVFPSPRNETAKDYFQRLAKFLEENSFYSKKFNSVQDTVKMGDGNY